MVIVQLLGGLGNQMFQYALGRQLADSNGTELKLDTSILRDWSPGKHAVNRSFDLDIFALKPTIATKDEISPYHTALMTTPQKIVFKIKTRFFGNPAIQEKQFHFDSNVLNLKGNIYLSGTWQSYKYFERIEKLIRTDFEFISPMSDHANELSEKIKQVNSVCLNVRRTDYVSVASTAQTMGVISLEYYELALQLMKESIGDFCVFIFSDDIEWCKKNMDFIEQPICFVEHRYAGWKFSDYLQLMKCCRHYIIPNSTFAWWGAWLNSNAEKMVIAPKQWMNDPYINTHDLIPDTWIRL
ncbi:MAG: alpha-1,2-fucosyltransferase [Cytophagales bacterium]|nr:alpha-1,2-fucosyltransferase [Cytophagales bacterium]MCA6368004.1 alpha-1,2-fucosyltransferase [Cytophagales bacterium]MCA6370518.1 alpha-1,2-fucosyltransferase [Cytophagales bacterium]MCA6376577.1 alpha-1,2-fucosyltransferase [Cytophagales bacterium]MCA6384407.1 alpha-1,2-fucosyltransferase [Cytophagales bacterium]